MKIVIGNSLMDCLTYIQEVDGFSSVMNERAACVGPRQREWYWTLFIGHMADRRKTMLLSMQRTFVVLCCLEPFVPSITGLECYSIP